MRSYTSNIILRRLNYTEFYAFVKCIFIPHNIFPFYKAKTSPTIEIKKSYSKDEPSFFDMEFHFMLNVLYREKKKILTAFHDSMIFEIKYF